MGQSVYTCLLWKAKSSISGDTMPLAIPAVRIVKTDILSDNWYTLRKVTFEIEKADDCPLMSMEMKAAC
jgi:hypothetical protein